MIYLNNTARPACGFSSEPLLIGTNIHKHSQRQYRRCGFGHPSCAFITDKDSTNLCRNANHWTCLESPRQFNGEKYPKRKTTTVRNEMKSLLVFEHFSQEVKMLETTTGKKTPPAQTSKRRCLLCGISQHHLNSCFKLKVGAHIPNTAHLLQLMKRKVTWRWRQSCDERGSWKVNQKLAHWANNNDAGRSIIQTLNLS